MRAYYCIYTTTEWYIREEKQNNSEYGQKLVDERENSEVLLARSVELSIHILNRSPTFVVQNMTPKEAWNGRKPSVEHFRIFGCIAYAHVPDEKRKKLDDKKEKCLFLGVSKTSKTYKLFNPLTEKIVTSRDVVFDEESTRDWKRQQPTQFLHDTDVEGVLPTYENSPETTAAGFEVSAEISELETVEETKASNAIVDSLRRVRKRPA